MDEYRGKERYIDEKKDVWNGRWLRGIPTRLREIASPRPVPPWLRRRAVWSST